MKQNGAIAASLLLNILFQSNLQAQLIPDRTLGPERSVVTPFTLLQQRIDGGAIRGTNLFHSFLEFNVGDGRGVYFANPVGIENILTRVTGSNPSNIFGTLGVLGNANLFLINPNGIYFGPNARLEVRGSFLATTADGIQLGTQGYFSATDLPGSQLLSVRPEALFSNALRNHQVQINNRGNLAVGGDFTLIADELNVQGQLSAGGNLTLVGASLTNSPWNLQTNSQQTPSTQGAVRIQDNITHPFIATAVGNLLVQGNAVINIFALNHPDSGLFSGGDMVLRSGNTVGGDAHYNSGGNFRIENLDGSLGGLFSPKDPVIRATGDVFIAFYQGASLHIFAGGSVTIRDFVWIQGPDTLGNSINPTTTPDEATVALSDGSSVVIDGNAEPTLDIRAGTTTVGTPAINTGTPSGADIQLGTVFFADVGSNPFPGRVLLTNQYQPNPNLKGNIRIDGFLIPPFGTISILNLGGVVDIDSKGEIVLNGILNAGAEFVGNTFLGNGGDVRLIAEGDIRLSPEAAIASNGLLSGNITLNSNSTISIQGNSTLSLRSRSDSPVAGLRGGDIHLTARSLSLTDGIISTAASGRAIAGNVTIDVREMASLDGSRIFSRVEVGAIADGGDVNITAGSLLLNNNSALSASTEGEGNSGNVNVTTGSFSATNNSSLAAVNFGRGNAGNVKLDVRETASFDGSQVRSNVRFGGVGNGGNINVTANALLLSNNSTFSASTFGRGNAGNINLNVRESLSFDRSNAFSTVGERAIGKGGNINITTGSFLATNDAQLSVNTLGRGNAGEIDISARESIALNGSQVFSNVGENAVGNGGIVNLTTGSFSATNNAFLGTIIFGRGDAGGVNLNARETVSFDNSSALSGVGNNGVGKGGNVNITTGSLILRDRALLGASTRGRGNAGGVNINARDTVTLDGESGILTEVRPGGVGNSGKIGITTGSLFLTDRSGLTASTVGQGDAGEVNINARDTVAFDRASGVASLVQPGAVGNGGNIEVTAGSLFLTNDAALTASTLGRGNAGGVKINVRETVAFDGSGAFSTVEPGAVGNGGGVNIIARSLVLTNDATVSSSTEGIGNAGQISVRVADAITLRDSEIINRATNTARGNGGAIALFANALQLDNSRISSNNQSQGRAGNLNLQTRRNLNVNRSQITATTASGDGGDLNLQLGNNLILRDNSLISTTAGQAGTGGDGGNINLAARFVVGVPLENSDITANAFEGRGGNIRITTNGIYGLSFRPRLTPLSDITASSEFGLNGSFDLNLLSFPAEQGLNQLPGSLVDAESAFARDVCRLQNGKIAGGSSLTITGRGGLPPSPLETLTPLDGVVEWSSWDDEETGSGEAGEQGSRFSEQSFAPNDNLSTKPAQGSTVRLRDRTPEESDENGHPKEIRPAQGWILQPDGSVILTAEVPIATVYNSGFGRPDCRPFRNSR